MFFDARSNSYKDVETGQVIFTETENDSETESSPDVETPFASIVGRVQAPQEHNPPSQLELDIIAMHLNEDTTRMEPTVVSPDEEPSSADWIMARAMQALEFEISNEMINGLNRTATTEEQGDFLDKELRASKSCRRQILTLSTFICVVQIALLVSMIQTDGYESSNPVVGPSAESMVRYGAKEAALIVYDDQWWRLFSSTMLHAGIFHLIPNVAIQLRIGGYLNLIYGTPKWFFIYLVSGIFGEMLSCIFLPAAVGVGSSGALMGLLASWLIWIIFRWEKIPVQCRSQRNCQLTVVTGAIVITLATSFTPRVDWAAHLGGAIQGLLWGMVLLSSELDNQRNQLLLRLGAAASAITLIIVSVWYIAAVLEPPRDNLALWSENDDWGR